MGLSKEIPLIRLTGRGISIMVKKHKGKLWITIGRLGYRFGNLLCKRKICDISRLIKK